MRSSITYRTSLIGLAGLLLIGCTDLSLDWDFESEPENLPPQTKILRIEIGPNPVKGGEEITFTCIIEDSLDPSFNYQWSFNFDNDTWLDSTTTENSITLTSTKVPGRYNGYISVFNNSDYSSSLPASGNFQYSVIE